MAELKLTEQQHAAVYDRGGSLLLSAAVFRTNNKNEFASADPVTGEAVQFG